MNSVEDSLITNEEELIANHKKEKKELQAKITKLKKSVPKGDKRKLKEIKLEITILENNLADKHKLELSELAKNEVKNKQTTLEEAADEIETLTLTNNVNDDNLNKSKVSKAKRKRDRKAAKLKERNNEIEVNSQKDYLNSQRYKEEELMKKILAKNGLQMKSDGNCLYYAVEDQLSTRNIEVNKSMNELRLLTSEYMLKNADEFLPFLTKHDTGDCYTYDEFVHYCDDIKNTSAWGGQLELRALSQALQIPIHVIQAEAPPVVIGDEFNNQKEIILTYHRHQFGLGEHYNSVTEDNQAD